MTAAGMVTLLLLVLGCCFFFAGMVGLWRFPDTRARLHALTKADNLGIGLICAALAVHDGSWPGVIRLALIWLLMLVASTFSAFFIARWTGAEAPPLPAGEENR